MDKCERLAETKRLLKWCAAHTRELTTICGIATKTYEPEGLGEIIRELEQEELYPLIVFIFLCWRNQAFLFLPEFMDTLALERLYETWDQAQEERLANYLIDDIEEYMGERRCKD